MNADNNGYLRKLLTPSLSDFFFLAILVWSFMSGSPGWQSLLYDGDTGLHIRIGDLIAANHTVPHLDPFAFSKPAGVWYAFEWLSETSFSVLHSAWGLKGVVLMCAVVIGLSILTLLQYMIWRRANGLIAILVALVACSAISIHFHARPHIFTLLFLAASIWLIAADRQRHTPAVWLLIPLTVVWCNAHGGFVILFAYLGILVAGCVLEALAFADVRTQRISDAIRYSIVGLACAAASLLNPYGINLHLHILETLRSTWIMTMVDEFKSPSFRGERLMHYMLLLFLGIGVCGLLIRRRNITDALLILFFAYESLLSARHVPLYALVATPIVAVELSILWTEWAASQSRKSIIGVIDDMSSELGRKITGPSLWTAVVILTLAVAPGIRWPTGFPSDLFPVEMVKSNQALIASSRVFTEDQWADYLIYSSYPKQKVFFDGRHNYYGERIGTDYVRLLQGDYRYREILAKYDIDLALCPVSMPLATLLKTNGDWAIAADDGKNVLFRRR